MKFDKKDFYNILLHISHFIVEFVIIYILLVMAGRAAAIM